jgi:hypothetical protein
MKVTKWSIHSGELTVSEQQAEQTPADAGSAAGEPTVSAALHAQDRSVAVPEPVVESPAIAPDHEAPSVGEMPKDEPVKAGAAEVEIQKADAKPKAGLARDKLLIMSAGERVWHGPEAAPASSAVGHGKRRLSAMAAVVALAVIAGALGGALATSGMTHVADVGAATSPSANPALEAAVARIDADILALKAGLEQTSKTGMAQFNKTSDRLERIEKAQAEPAAKLAKLSEAVEKLRTAQQVAPAAAVTTPAATPKDVTGSVTAPPGAAPLPMSAPPATAAATPKTEVGRLPTVDGWYLADVGYGGALIQNRRGTYEVYAGDFIPGLGRIDAIRKQDGRWVVVTSKGLIVAR